MSASQTSRLHTHRRCWMCTRVRPIRGGQMTPTHVPHWVCRRCWKLKYLQIADGVLNVLTPARKLAYLTERGIDLTKPPHTRA